MKTILVSLILGSVVALGQTNGSGTGILPVHSDASRKLSIVYASTPHPTGGTPVPLTPAFINQLADELHTNSPALAAAFARTNAAARAVSAVRTWEDPMARGGYMFADDQDMMRMEDGDVFYGVEQKLPLWGKPQAMRRMAQAELGVVAADADLRFQTLRFELAKALLRAALAAEILAIGEEDLAWAGKMQTAADARYRSGAGTLTEVLRLQNEQARRADQLTTARAQLRQEEIALNRLLNRPADTRWPRLVLPEVAAPVVYSERLVQLARDNEPRLRKMRGEVRMADAAVNKARRERYPEVGVGVNARNDSSNGDWRQTEVMLNVSLPIFNRGRYRADIAREEARRQAAELDVVDMELGVREEVHGLTVKIDAARREVLLYRREITPRSEQALAAAQSAWQSGNGMFLDVLEARRMLLEARLMSARALAEQWQMLSELVLCCGLADLEALQMIGAHPESQNGGNKP
jgi:cobalt-zinc-cadmium efflux system outer membrane protein